MFLVKRNKDCVIIEKRSIVNGSETLVETIPDLGDILWDYGFTEEQIDRVLDAFDDGVTTVNINVYVI